MENSVNSSSTSSINTFYLGTPTMISLLPSPQISPRTMTFNRGGCECNCECYKRSNYATLAPHKPVVVDKKMIKICKHFSSCPLRGKSCEYPDVFSSPSDEDNYSDPGDSILSQNSRLGSIDEDSTHSERSSSPTHSGSFKRCSSFTFEATITKN
jgi:hypothetical protein